MSSRNRYLDDAARRQAACIYRALRAAQAELAAGERDAARLARTIRQAILDAGPCRIDYVAVADAETLAPVQMVDRPCVAAVAVHLGGARLIDNATLEP